MAVHVDQELGIGREQRHLPLDVPAIRAMCIGVDKVADGEAIGDFLQAEVALI